MPPDAPPGDARGWRSLSRFLLPALVIGGLLTLVMTITGASRPDRPQATAQLGVIADPSDVYDPVTAGERLPEGFRQVLPRDAILPIYDPTFVSGPDSGWPDDALVIGIAVEDQAKAYPVSLLNRREMVVDSLAGIPILVTW